MAERIASAPVRYPFSFVVAGDLFHTVQISIGEDGSVSGKVLQAFEPERGRARISF